uniref:Uncharacterized protein n=1 Tax=Meloidogyne hapla TaxID=6305 RepID=A0A1I8BBY9_MELHA
MANKCKCMLDREVNPAAIRDHVPKYSPACPNPNNNKNQKQQTLQLNNNNWT